MQEGKESGELQFNDLAVDITISQWSDLKEFWVWPWHINVLSF